MLLPMWLRVYRGLAALALRISGARPFAFRHGEVRLRVWTAGPEDGEPWVLLHGLGALAAGWLPVVRELRSTCRLLVPELSAAGGSRVPGGALAVADGVPEVAALIDRVLGGRPVTLGGYSLGGWMALRLALARPDLVARLVLIAPGGYREQDWRRIERLLRVSDAAGAENLVDAMFLRPPLPPRLMRRAFLRTFTSPGVRRALDKLSERDALTDAELARVAVPTALVWGEQDGVFTVDVAERMAAALPAARLVRLPASHLVQWDRPRDLVAAVRDFRRSTPLNLRSGKEAS